ncbi:hypothetical protein L1987_69616 [Smallanthus sonchifolius]|uniref:Uncharacterized protein n=1 Tax=Smallanthus sonchifolius TaxID=185202 RepID=A0ACB9B5M6_9ASTR|nr:hypothetical protein L1987_69616 [Smallanthus sonchifolius]
MVWVRDGGRRHAWSAEVARLYGGRRERRGQRRPAVVHDGGDTRQRRSRWWEAAETGCGEGVTVPVSAEVARRRRPVVASCFGNAARQWCKEFTGADQRG